MQANYERLTFIDGLRAILVIVVILEHIVKLIAPQAHTVLVTTPQYTEQLINLSIAPFNIFINGAWPVATFFVLSGFVLTYYLKQNTGVVNALIFLVNRYTKFTLMIATSYLIIYFVGQYELDYLAQLKYNNDFNGSMLTGVETPSVAELITLSVVQVLFFFKHDYNPPLWTLGLEIYGGILIVILVTFLSFFKSTVVKLILAVAAIIMLALFLTGSVFILFIMLLFLIGASLYYIRPLKNKKANYITVYILGVVSVLLFSVDVRGSFHNPFSMIVLSSEDYFTRYFYNGIGGWCLIASILMSNKLQIILTNQTLVHIGKLSFAIYVTHYIVIATVGGYLANLANGKSWYYDLLIVNVLFLCIYLMGWIVHTIVERNIYKELKMPIIGTSRKDV